MGRIMMKTNTKALEQLQDSPAGGEVFHDAYNDMTITQYKDHEVHHTNRRSGIKSKLPFAYSKHKGFNYE